MINPEILSDSVTLYEGDCLDVLPTLTGIDAVVTDPPYGLGDKWAGGGGGAKSSWKFNPTEAQSWDGGIHSSVSKLPEMSSHVLIWGGNYYPLPPSRCWFLWDKCQPDTWTTAQAEMAWTNIDRPVRTFRMCQAVAHTEMGEKYHPTQKPLSLMRWCIRMMRLPNSCTILDPFAGSGTTGVAAILEGRKAILIEKDPKYCDIIRRRIAEAEATGPGSLFKYVSKSSLFESVSTE